MLDNKMKIKEVNIKDLKFPSYNPRKKLTPKDKEYQKIKNSIKEFGYSDLVVINKDNTIISGNQRTRVMLDMGIEKIKVVQLDLDKDKEKALNVALNKITGQWDEQLLSDLLMDLNSTGFDVELTGFDDVDFNMDVSFELEEEPKENERERTNNAYNLELFNSLRASGKYQIPIIENDGYIPKDLIGFNYAKTSSKKDCGIHFYIDDYQFERIWNNPKDYLDILDEYECVLSPDFSLYLDMSMSLKIWNVYRSRLIGQYLQNRGLIVIPTISWADEDTFEFCFDGIPKGSIVSISTIGVKKNKKALNIWTKGVNEMIKRIQPSAILIYGGKLDYDFKDIDRKSVV